MKKIKFLRLRPPEGGDAEVPQRDLLACVAAMRLARPVNGSRAAASISSAPITRARSVTKSAPRSTPRAACPKRVRPPGAVVLQVDPQSAAERAGLKQGDLVT